MIPLGTAIPDSMSPHNKGLGINVFWFNRKISFKTSLLLHGVRSCVCVRPSMQMSMKFKKPNSVEVSHF